MRVSLLLLLVPTMGCGDDAAPPSPPDVARPTALSPAVCAERVASMSDVLPRPGPLQPRAGAEALPVVSGGREVAPTTIVTVRASRIFVDARPVAELGTAEAAERLASDLERVASQWSMLHPDDAWEQRVLLEVDAAVPARELWQLVSALSEDLVWDLLVQNADGPTPGEPLAAPDWVEESWQVAVDAPTFEARRPVLERAFHRAIGDCLAARPHAHLLFLNDPESGTTRPELTLEEALRACGCIGVDFEALTPLLQRGMSARHRPLASIRIRAQEAAPEPVALLAGATYGELLAALIALPPERREAPISLRFEN